MCLHRTELRYVHVQRKLLAFVLKQQHVILWMYRRNALHTQASCIVSQYVTHLSYKLMYEV